jgi:hypothetical protein
MRRQIAVVMCSLVFGFMTLSSHAIAQQKTVAACREEWRANKAANQANGITLKAYVAQCRGGATPAETTAAPTAPAAPAPTAETGQKTARECREEWRANKAANQANGVTEKAYVAQCRSGASPAQPTAAPAAPAAPAPTAETGQKTVAACREEWRANKAANQANGITLKAYVAQCRGGATPAETTAAPPPPLPAPGATPTAAPAAPAPTAAPAAPAPAPTAAAPQSRPAPPPPPTAGPAPSVPASPAGANEFSTETEAKTRCPTDTVVWVTLSSNIYHFTGTRYYGNTKRGAYMCERDAAAAGMRAAKNETHP